MAKVRVKLGFRVYAGDIIELVWFSSKRGKSNEEREKMRTQFNTRQIKNTQRKIKLVCFSQQAPCSSWQLSRIGLDMNKLGTGVG